MKKIIRITESDMVKIIKKIIKEDEIYEEDEFMFREPEPDSSTVSEEDEFMFREPEPDSSTVSEDDDDYLEYK